MKYVQILLLILLVSLPLGLHSQIPGLGDSSEIQADIIPSAPGAFETVRIELASYVTDINAASITWSVDGKRISSGIGQRTFDFKTGDFGSQTTVQVTVVSKEGGASEYIYKFRPVKVDLIWQSESLVPALYKGKALFSHQNQISFIALPHLTNSSGVELDPKELVYKWSLNDSANQDSSGYGKNVFSFEGSLISREMKVSVEVSDGSRETVGYAFVRVEPVEPMVLFYEKSSLYGIQFQKALKDTIDLTGTKEMTVLGLPMYSGIPTPTFPDIAYKWAINGQPLKNPESQNIQIFRRKEGATGTAKISLSVENVKKILQYSSSYFNLKFTDKTTSSL